MLNLFNQVIELSYKVVLILFIFLFFAFPILAVENNKVGIHLSQPNIEDLKTAAVLVNSNGGDWGYVTLVLQDNDLNREKWQNVFDELRKLHLIPIIRLATHPCKNYWVRPQDKEIKKIVKFLNSLNWVVKNCYIILFNEPNHATEWGGKVDVKGYVNIAYNYAEEFKKANSNFFVMLAALDAAAPHRPPAYEDETVFLRYFLKKKGLFTLIDGWASHSYPQNYLSPPWRDGRRSIKTYEWELNYLRGHGLKRNLPVFITETGWINKLPTASEYMKYAFEEIWMRDNRVQAVTPFLLNYQTSPFQKFSWIKGNGEVYPIFNAIKSIKKVSGEPQIVDKGLLFLSFPEELSISSNYHLLLTLKNTGEAIWDKNYQFKIDDNKALSTYSFSSIPTLSPSQEVSIPLYIKTSDMLGRHEVKIFLKKKNKTVAEIKKLFNLVVQPTLQIKLSMFPRSRNDGEKFEVQIFNSKEELIFKQKNLISKNKVITITRVPNVIFGEKYRIVVLKPFYLPRQKVVKIKFSKQRVELKPLLPLDFDLDGAFTLHDVVELIFHPSLWSYLLPFI